MRDFGAKTLSVVSMVAMIIFFFAGDMSASRQCMSVMLCCEILYRLGERRGKEMKCSAANCKNNVKINSDGKYLNCLQKLVIWKDGKYSEPATIKGNDCEFITPCPDFDRLIVRFPLRPLCPMCRLDFAIDMLNMEGDKLKGKMK